MVYNEYGLMLFKHIKEKFDFVQNKGNAIRIWIRFLRTIKTIVGTTGAIWLTDCIDQASPHKGNLFDKQEGAQLMHFCTVNEIHESKILKFKTNS